MTLIDRAVEILRAGGLVAFPTETVYGLGADATSESAVGRIFAAKGRPATNPLIVHVASATVAQRFATTWPESARKLAERFWPGPLTLVLPKTAQIPPNVTAGLQTVALRVPSHPLALELLRAFEGPVAAPSANRSTRLSPTTAQHVREELGDAVDLIVDGGPCMVGIESTVLDLTGNPPTILRPGGVSRQEIEAIVGLVRIFHGAIDPKKSAASPGQHGKHYAPRTPAYRFEVGECEQYFRQADAQVGQMVLLALTDMRSQIANWKSQIVQMPNDPARYARELYAALRQADQGNVDAIYIEMPPDTAEWHAVRDRLMRATRPLGPNPQ